MLTSLYFDQQKRCVMDNLDHMLTIEEFCRNHRICRGTFYKLVRRGQAPRITRVGRRVLISAEAVKEWRREREAA